jgi:hypothetical protein
MEIGDLVDVYEQRGCGSHITSESKGLGIVIGHGKPRYINIGSLKNVNLGVSAYILLSTGELKTFHENDLIKVATHE